MTIAAPSATASSVIMNGCRSVGKPGYGSVAMSTARGRSGPRTRKPSARVAISAPAADSLSSTMPRCPGSPLRTTTSPPVMAAANAQVPATIRSGTTRCSTGLSRSAPSTSRVEVPIPSTVAPIRRSIRHRSTISGSRATLSITVRPLASAAAISRFSVAPTLGKSSRSSAPCRPCGASATRKPWSSRTSAPISVSPATCMSSPREPIASPPGSATSANPQRAVSGPSTLIEARIARTRS